MMKRQLVIDYNEACGGVLYGPNRCTPLGRRAVSLLLSSFGVRDRKSFLRLSRANRHHITLTVMQHTGGMRFGHFTARAYKRRQFHLDDYSGDISLTTDWHRYSGQRRYTIRFLAIPTGTSRWYSVRAVNGDVITDISAATIMRWHFDQLEQAGEDVVFAPGGTDGASRLQRQAWLREALRAALPVNETRARAMIDDVTPHSFRPGLAGDLLEDGHSLDSIALQCRWQGPRVVRIYAERMSLSAARRGTGFRKMFPRRRA